MMLHLYVLFLLSFAGEEQQDKQPGLVEFAQPLFMNKDAHQGTVLSLELSPDETTLASLGADQWLKVWEARQGNLLWKQKVNNLEVRSNAVYSPDGKTISVGEKDGQVASFDAATGKLQHRRQYHADKIQRLAYSPDGKWLATASHDNTIKLWDTVTGKESATVPFTSWSLTFSPDSSVLAIPTNSGIQLWDLATKKVVRKFFRADAMHTDVCFGLGGKYIIGELASQPRGYCIWDASTGKMKETILGIFFTQCPMVATTQGKSLLTATTDRIALWDLATGQAAQELSNLPFTLTDSQAAVGKQGVYLASRDGLVACYRPVASKPVDKLPAYELEEIEEAGMKLERLIIDRVDGGLGKVALSRDGKQLYFSMINQAVPESLQEQHQLQGLGSVCLWDVTGKRMVGMIPPPGQTRFGHYLGEAMGPIVAFAVSPNDELMALASDREISLWEVRTKKKLAVIDGLHQNRLPQLGFPLGELELKFTPDSKQLVISKTLGTWIWDISSKKLLTQCDDGGHVSFLAGQKYFVTACYHNRVKLWETATGKLLDEDHPMMGILRASGVSDDSQWLVAGGEGGAMVWKPQLGGNRPTLERHLSLKVAGPVYGLSISNDGKRALTTGSVPQLWNVETGKMIAQWGAVKRSGHSALSPDGKLAVILARGSIYFWKP